MRLLAELRTRWRAAMQRTRLEADFEAELRDHLDREIEARTARGASPDEARRTAMRDFGSVAAHTDEWRHGIGVRLWDDLRADVRYACRMLARDPAFAVVVALTLALGIGANMTIFSVIEAVLLEPLPYPDQQRLVDLRQYNIKRPVDRTDVSPANFVDWRQRASDAIALAAVEPFSRTYLRADGPERVPTWLVTEGFFDILGTSAWLGRTFTPEEFTSGRDRVLVLGYATWLREFGGDRTVIGRSIVMDKEPYRIVGVMPPGFGFPRGRDVWGPKVFNADELQRRSVSYFRVVGRLTPGTTPERAQLRLDTIAQQLRQEYARENADTGIAAVPLKDSMVGSARTILIVFLVGVGLLLIVACVNVSNLLLVRLSRRQQEIGVRMALGASASRVRRQILTESLVLAGLGSIAATLFAIWSTGLLRTIVPSTLPRAEHMAVGWRTIAFGCSLAIAAAAGISLAAFSGTRTDEASLRLSSRTRTTTASNRRLQHVFVAAELAVAMILLVTAALFVRSLTTLLGEPRGFSSSDVAVAVVFAWQEYPQPRARGAFIKQVVERLEELPGVDYAGAGSSLPLAERIGPETGTLSLVGDVATTSRPLTVQASIVTPGYFETLRIGLQEGRRLAWSDDERAAPVVIVNERLARQQWPGRSAIGQRIVLRFAGAPATREIVGVVADVRRELTKPAEPAVYVPHAQSPTGSMTFIAHTTRDSTQLLPQIKRTIGGVNATLAVSSTVMLDDVLRNSVSARQFNLRLVGFFALASLSLAMLGTYGVMACATNERLKEIGIRLALGARPQRAVFVVLFDGLRMAAAGVLVGVLAAAAMGRLVRDLLYGIAPLDLPSYAAAAFIILAVATVASVLPAWQAARADVLAMLRAD